MKGRFVEFVRNLRDPVRARRQEKIREVELTWSDHDLSNFRVFALGLQPAEMADVCYALSDGSAIPLLELLVDYAPVNDELMAIAFQSLEKTPMSARLFLADRLLASPREPVRAGACKMLSGAVAAAGKLESALGDDSELVVAAAIRSLVAIGYAGADKRLLPHVLAGSVELRSLAMDALMKLNPASWALEREALRMLAAPDEEPAIRKKSAQALAAMRSADGCRALTGMLNDQGAPEDMRLAAAQALGAYSDPSVAQALLATVEGDAFLLAKAAMRSLAAMDPGVTIPVCGECLRGGSQARALAAAELAGLLASPDAVTLLRERLDEERRLPVVAALAEALGKSGGSGAPEVWDALRRKLRTTPEAAVPLTAALADCAGADRLDDFAALIDELPEGGAAELALRRLAAFCRTTAPTPALLRRALAILDSPSHILRVSAVEILAYSGDAALRKPVLTEMAGFGKNFPTRRLLRVMLKNSDGELATLFEGLGRGASVLVPEAAAEADAMGPGGEDFFRTLAAWVRLDALRAREGLAAAAILDPAQLTAAMRGSADGVFLLEAWAGLPPQERLRNNPDLDYLFASCDIPDRLLALEILDRLPEERHLRPVAMLAFGERAPDVKTAAAGLVRKLLLAAPGAGGGGR